jgi:hypothetical protein
MPLFSDRFSEEYWGEFTRLIAFMDSRELGDAAARYVEAFGPYRFHGLARRGAAAGGSGRVASLFAAHNQAVGRAEDSSRRKVPEDWPMPTSFESRGLWAWFESPLNHHIVFGTGSVRPDADEDRVATAPVAIHGAQAWYGRGVAFLTSRALRVAITGPPPLFSQQVPRFRVSVPIDSIRELAVQDEPGAQSPLGVVRMLFMTRKSPPEGPYGGFLMEFDGGSECRVLVRELRSRWLAAWPEADAPGFDEWLHPV